MELTKLQRLGISALLIDLQRIDPLICDGTIKFKNREKAETCEMYVKDYKGIREYHYTVEFNENIDDTIQYEYSYDGVNNIFRIITITSIVGES